jgi:E3 ubiquitin-protein ligase DOA10
MTALNRLKAQMMKAKLRKAPDAANLEEQYNTFLALAFSVEFLLWITKMFARVSSNITLQFPFLEHCYRAFWRPSFF